MKIEDLKGKKIAILGFGKEGKSTLDFLLKNGVNTKDITVLDHYSEGTSNPSLVPLNRGGRHPDLIGMAGGATATGITFISGENYLDNLGQFDVIIKSPGISPYNPKISPYKEKLTSQIQIFFDNYNGKVINITGTKGKSTISTLAYETLKKAGYKVKLLGNIGIPVLGEINFNKNEYDFIVFETSSYMLEGLKKKNYISILSNIYEDHLDRHNGFENYKNAKLNILSGSEHSIVLDYTFKKYIPKGSEAGIKIFGKNGDYYFKDGNFYSNGKIVFDENGIRLLGEHNRINVCAILGICDIIGINPKILKEVLIEFNPLPHRLEFVGNFKGIDFYDDAISTTPESTIEAIKIFNKNIGTIFLGGLDRGYSFENLVKLIIESEIKNFVLFPDTGAKIKKLLPDSVRILETKNMKEAVEFAYKNTPAGKVCLLSCASPSYSIWKNFEEKGNEFKKWVAKIGTIGK
ncbi:MAG: UDP-N-acetylmuramoyl-L-alanine--D-glutamate ligase [Candidatus Gracilibacteria bacterium]|nr:UDP-N-acetylmuramoyl-L-alanine--D-glutamate ligase [Candidatus Gracilibacteria bacterium]